MHKPVRKLIIIRSILHLARISLRIEILYTASWNNVTGGPWISESAERRKEKLEAI
jgi:hypothetical protein